MIWQFYGDVLNNAEQIILPGNVTISQGDILIVKVLIIYFNHKI